MACSTANIEDVIVESKSKRIQIFLIGSVLAQLLNWNEFDWLKKPAKWKPQKPKNLVKKHHTKSCGR
jgi:hypothetical protein